LILFVPMFVFFIGIMAIPYATGNCTNVAIIQGYIFAILVIIWLIAVILTGLLDLILSIRKCKNCQIVKEDNVFYFRTEVYLLGGFFVFSLLLGLVLAFTVPGWAPIETGIGTSIYVFLAWYFQAGFVLTITVYRWIGSWCRKKPKDSSVIREILMDPEAFGLFKQFAQREFSSENILCWSEIQNFKKQVDKADRKKVAEMIVIGFLSGKSSELEVNVSEQELEPVRLRTKSEEFDSTLFDKIEETLLINLRDMVGRFIFSAEFIAMQKRRNFMKEAIHQNINV
jgi:hypothetical protein